jgi:ADP-ribosylglycohydrolase
MELVDRYCGAILGLAIGDALGHPTEFVGSVSGIRARWGPSGVTGFEPTGRHPAGTFTDDTQMSIAVARAFLAAGAADLDALMARMAAEFVAWSRSAQNNRAPGGACMSGCSRLEQGVPWRSAGVADSKGCGAAMRAAPVGLVFHRDEERLIRVALAQSAPTHRHPTGFASSVAAAAAVAWAARGEGLDGLLDFVEACVKRITPEQLVEMGAFPQLVDRYGVGEMTAALQNVRANQDRDEDDVCHVTGGAWIGEEAVAAALWCVLRAGGDFRQSVLRGANSSGDSDSIASIAGGIAGAMAGVAALPSEWVRDVEQGARLRALAVALHHVATTGEVVSPDPELAFFSGRVRDAADPEPDSDADPE